jgi:UDPglucose 6-dehydrogenase
MKPTIGVIGAGYVGLVVASSYASMGFSVILCEKDDAKLALLCRGIVPFFEPGLTELFSSVLNGNLQLCNSIQDFFKTAPVDLIFSCVPTPVLENGHADTSFVIEVLETLITTTDKNILLINKSTITPGFSKSMQAILEKAKHQITLVHNPEFLRQGQALTDFAHPDRIVFGLTPNMEKHELASLKAKLLSLARDFVSDDKIIFTDFVTAELIKHAANAMLACRITFMNQIFRIAKTLGADMPTVKRGVGMDHRIGSLYLEAGAGFGGSCLPKDLQALIALGTQLEIDVSLLQTIFEFNKSQLDWFYSDWKHDVGEIKGQSIAVRGISFKPLSSDLRNSVQIELVRKIVADEPKNVLIMDQTLGEEELEKIKLDLGIKYRLSESDPEEQDKTILLLRH